MNDDRHIATDSQHNFHFLWEAVLCQVTGRIFTILLHDVEALVPLLMRAYTRPYCIPFPNARAKNEGG